MYDMGKRYGNCMGMDIGSILDGRVDIIGRYTELDSRIDPTGDKLLVEMKCSISATLEGYEEHHILAFSAAW